MNDLRNGLCAFACMLLASTIPSGLTYADDRRDDDRHHSDRDFRIEVLSSRPYMVSGSDALVRVTVKDPDVSLRQVRVELNGADVARGVHRAGCRLHGRWPGRRSRPAPGQDRLEVNTKGKDRGHANARRGPAPPNYNLRDR